ncbi:hypothetical protein BDQ17DRAFT_1218349, partial [Cyathus striatus]
SSEVSYSAAMILQWMNTLQNNWLTIFDNADSSLEIVEKYIPPGNNGNILITSRNPEYKGIVSVRNSTEISIMSEQAAVELLLKSSGLNDDSDKYCEVAADICAEFYFLPLAIG